VFAGTHPDSAGEVYNVHDDELLTASRYLREYKQQVQPIRSVRLPYFTTKDAGLVFGSLSSSFPGAIAGHHHSL